MTTENEVLSQIELHTLSTILDAAPNHIKEAKEQSDYMLEVSQRTVELLNLGIEDKETPEAVAAKEAIQLAMTQVNTAVSAVMTLVLAEAGPQLQSVWAALQAAKEQS